MLPGLGQWTLPFAQPPADGEWEALGAAAEPEGAAPEAEGAAEAEGATDIDPPAEEGGAALTEGVALTVETVVMVSTPPLGAGAAEVTAEEDASAEVLGAGAAEPPEVGAAPPPPTGAPSCAQFGPVGTAMGYMEAVLAAWPAGSLVVTYFPGRGNLTLTDSVVGQSSTAAILATNMAGKSASSLPSPPLSCVLMQFMYSSRLPTLLYQTQAMMAWPFLTPFGIVKLNWFTQSTPLVFGSVQS